MSVRVYVVVGKYAPQPRTWVDSVWFLKKNAEKRQYEIERIWDYSAKIEEFKVKDCEAG